MANTFRSPEELRDMFGANLKRLAQNYPSVSELCRQLGINRTQFNRYLLGESFPRPDVLDRICRFFDVDARILLKPLDEIEAQPRHPSVDILDHFLAARHEPELPGGFFHAAETEPGNANEVQNRLLFVRRVKRNILLRGYEPRALMPDETPCAREIQGIVCKSDTRVFILMSRRGGQDYRVMVVSKTANDSGPCWVGHTTYLSGASGTPPITRPAELVHLGGHLPAALRIGRAAPGSPSASRSHAVSEGLI